MALRKELIRKVMRMANRPNPDTWGRFSEHTLPLHLPLTSRHDEKSNHPKCGHPSFCRNGYTRIRGRDGLPIDKCDRLVCLPGWSSNLRKKSTSTNGDPKTCCAIQSTSSRAKAKVGGPKDLPTKVEIGKNRYESRKKRELGKK